MDLLLPDSTRPLRQASGPFKQKGWRGLGPGAYVAYQVNGSSQRCRDLTLGLSLRNIVDEQKLILQLHAGIWKQVCVCHLPPYVGSESQQTIIVSEPKTQTLGNFAALVLVVIFLLGGELRHGSARMLSDRVWGLVIYVEDEDVFLGIREFIPSRRPAALEALPPANMERLASADFAVEMCRGVPLVGASVLQLVSRALSSSQAAEPSPRTSRS